MDDSPNPPFDFDTAGGDFDRLGRHLWYPIGAAAVARTAPGPGDRVLDACCGNGASAVPAAVAVGTSGRVDAVDLSDSLLIGLRHRAAGMPHVHTHQADVTTWAAEGYDIVQCVLGIFFFPDMEAGTRHLVSRARPGGTVGFTIWRRAAVTPAGQQLGAALARVTGVDDEPRPEHLIDRVNEARTFEAWLASLGLERVDVTEHELHVPMTAELAWLMVTGSGFASALAGLDADQVEQVRRVYLEGLARAGVHELDATTLTGVGVRAG